MGTGQQGQHTHPTAAGGRSSPVAQPSAVPTGKMHKDMVVKAIKHNPSLGRDFWAKQGPALNMWAAGREIFS